MAAGHEAAPSPIEEQQPLEMLEPAPLERSERVHFVVVVSRPVEDRDRAPRGSVLVTRYWHPRDRRWAENAFESLEHAIRLFVDESGWVLRQQQQLDGAWSHELIFEAHREDFTRPSTEEMLEDVGLTPEDVASLLKRVDGEAQ